MYPNLPSFTPPGETIVWSGTPGGGIVFRSTDIALVPFSILWCGFAIFWESSALRGGLLFFELWGLPFVLVGVYFVVGRFFVDAYMRSRMRYAVTDKAAYIASGRSNVSVRRFSGSEIDDVRIVRSADGSGTISFASANANYGNSRRASSAAWLPSASAFVKIRDVDRAYAAILATRT